MERMLRLKYFLKNAQKLSGMKILMLGWEYPPHSLQVSNLESQNFGGVGIACEALTVSLARRRVTIDFIVPHLFGGEHAPHMKLHEARAFEGAESYKEEYRAQLGLSSTERLSAPSGFKSKVVSRIPGRHLDTDTSPHLKVDRIETVLSPYQTQESYIQSLNFYSAEPSVQPHTSEPNRKSATGMVRQELLDGEVYGAALLEDSGRFQPPTEEPYASDLLNEVLRYSRKVERLSSSKSFDIVHAHDWMTFQAAAAVAKSSKKPLIVHIHSLEQDRRGVLADEQIIKIEGAALQAADRIITVSYYAAEQIKRFHSVDPSKIVVVHNGIYPQESVENSKLKRTWPKKVVLFLGRVTAQKGPEFFIEMAARVASHIPEVLFVLAGTGDLLPRVVKRVRDLGLEDHFLFPGFVEGQELEELLAIADLYVMPSVSEPFGLSALEAVKFDTPVILSKQSGVAEVLSNSFLADFWDVDTMAELVINGLLNDELRKEMAVSAKAELKDLHWDCAARKIAELYATLI